MQPTNQLELTYYLRDLERQALRDQATVARLGPCKVCARLRSVIGRFVRTLRATGTSAVGQKP